MEYWRPESQKDNTVTIKQTSNTLLLQTFAVLVIVVVVCEITIGIAEEVAVEVVVGPGKKRGSLADAR